MIAIYRVANRAENRITHRFAPKKSVVLVFGEKGERAAIEMSNGVITQDEGTYDANWADFVEKLGREEGFSSVPLPYCDDSGSPSVF